MCTCITYQGEDFYFGRNMDLEYSFGEKIVITPRNYMFEFKRKAVLTSHYAMIGMATVIDEYPLYAEAVNEKGLCIAGLNFPGNAIYGEEAEGMDNITPFEFIPWILGKCASVAEAETLLKKINIVNIPFREDLPLSPLHWMLSDKEKSIVLENGKDGMSIYENPYGVLTNNPPFEYHKMNLVNYLNLTTAYPKNRLSEGIFLEPYGQGMGGIGLPGDVSPASRFVRAVFLKENSVCQKDPLSTVSQVFHILDGVSMVRGIVITPEEKYDITTYSCCVNAQKGIYYYKTYENNQICAIQLFCEDLKSEKLICYELINRQQINYINIK